MDADKWSQGFLHQDMGRVKGGMDQEMASNSTCTRGGAAKAKPPEQLNCPRCNSTNTKFCYYNNYSLTQPRYFCKTCRRYWTEGGSLRNVPVGGGSRKNKRSIISSTSTSSSSASPKLPDLNPSAFPHLSSSQNPKITGHHLPKGQDLNLGFPVMQQETHHHGGLSQYLELPKVDNNNDQQSYYSSCNNNNTSSSSSSLSAMELLRTGMVSRGLNSFVPVPASDSTTLYSNGFSMQDYKPTLSFPIDGVGNRAGVQENGGRVFFPFGEMKPISSTNEVDDQNKEQSNPAAGYWNNGVLGGGSW